MGLRRGARQRSRIWSYRIVASALAAIVALGIADAALAADEPSEPHPSGPEIHAFVSQGFIKSTDNDYLASSQRGSFEFTEIGINFTQTLADDLRVGIQLFAHDLGPIGNFTPQFDWFYLDYRYRDWLGLRAGHTKIPFGLYNDSSDIDAARVPILLPQSVYPIDHRDYLLAQTGGELYGNVRLGDAGNLEYRGYGGTLDINAPGSTNPGIVVSNASVPYVFGGRLMWSTPLDGLVAAGSYQALRLDWDYDISAALIAPLQSVGLLPAGFTGRLPVQFRVKLWVGSLEYQIDNLMVSAEYSRWIGGFESEAPALLPPHVVNERYYGMVSYRVAPWFTPGAYYSVYYPNMDQRDGRQNYQRDAALSLRYDLNANWLLKVEGHWMNGTAALDPTLNGGKDPKTLTKDWGLLLVKTTAYF
jgi:hypothetical protein